VRAAPYHGEPSLPADCFPQEDEIVGNDSKAETTGRRLVYFAAERTLMAWIRAALALMALGFVMDRFDLVVRQVLTQSQVPLHPSAFSLWSGTLLTLLGTIMALTGAVRYFLFAFKYRRQSSTKPGNGLYTGVLFAVIVALMGIVIAFAIVNVTR
jgi:putative membrane protein